MLRGCLVAAGPWHLTLQAVLGRFAGLVADEGWHRHGHPLLRWGWLLTLARSHRLSGGLAPTGRCGAAPDTVGDSRVGRRAQNAPYRGDMPTFATPGRGNLGLTEALSHFRQAWSPPGSGIPGKHVLHHSSLDWVNAYAAGIARAVGIKQRALGGSSPRKKLATAQFGLAPSAQALGNEGPLVRGP